MIFHEIRILGQSLRENCDGNRNQNTLKFYTRLQNSYKNMPNRAENKFEYVYGNFKDVLEI